MLDGLKLFGMGYSMGRLREPCHSLRLPELSQRDGVESAGPALRFSVGLEDIEDLKADLDAGFERMRMATEDSPGATLFSPLGKFADANGAAWSE